MRRAIRWLSIGVAILLALPLLLIGFLNTGPGRRVAESAVQTFSGGTIALTGLAGRFPDELRAARLELRDTGGAWLTAEDLVLDWSPTRLLTDEARINRLAAAEMSIARLPASEPVNSTSHTTLPVRVVLDAVSVTRLDLSAAVVGAAGVFAVDATGQAESLTVMSADMSLKRIDAVGTYRVRANVNGAAVTGNVSAEEPAGGFLAALAKLPDLGALSLNLSADGPWSGVGVKLALRAGKLTASAQGQVDVNHQVAELDLTANAPAMTPRADVSWQSVAMDAHVHGAWTKPRAQGRLDIEDLAASGAAIRRVSATVDGDLGAVALNVTAEGVHLPGPAADLLAGAPVTLKADARLDDPARPVTFTLAHPLISVTGHANTAGSIGGQAHLDLPDLATLAAVGKLDVQGHAAIDVTAQLPADGPTLAVGGTIAVTGGMAPLPGLLGPEGHLAVVAALHGERVDVSRLHLDGHAVTLDVHGSATAADMDVSWQAALPDLSVLAATLRGELKGSGRVHGKPAVFATEADLTGEIATAQVPRGPITLSVAAHGLPDAPSGNITAQGTLDGAPLALDVTAKRQADGAMSLGITKADWKSLHAEGALSLAPAAALPSGNISLKMDRLDDFSKLLGQSLTGAVSAEATMQGAEARLKATVRNAALAGTASIGNAALNVTVHEPTTARQIDGSLDLAGLKSGAIGGTARLEAHGTPDALALRLTTTLAGLGGSPLVASAAARLDASARTVSLSALQATWQGETVRLLAPARIDAADGVQVDRLRLGLGQATVEVAGKLSPALDVTASLHNLPASLARLVMPDLHLNGTVAADAKLTGAPERPDGRLHLAVTGLRRSDGPGASMPAANITADATLARGAAALTARATAGANFVTLSGTAPLDPAGALNLRAGAAVDLTVLNPLLAGAGRRVNGRLTLDGTIAGTPAAPLASGTLRLANGDVQDIPQGIHISNIVARIEGNGDHLQIAQFSGRAGPGTLSVAGSVGLADRMPVNLTITGKNARPIASNLLTASMDIDMALRGDLLGDLAVSGGITVDRADVSVPEKLPSQVAVLNVIRPGQGPPPPSVPAPTIGLNVTLRAPGQVFVRGRGLDAELQGRITVTGTTAAPQPSGRFTLRHGTFSLAGITLTFTSGEVGFDGSRGFDPTLNFVATSSTSSVTATLTITGYASNPKFALSSVPDLPQDEILAQLLFQQASSALSPVQLAQAAAALAQLSGVGSGLDPLNSIRQKLGLDRLSVGNSANGTGAAVEAGRYITPRIFVGARQDTSGNGTQALVQFDVTRRLKLQATAGTSAPTSATGANSTTDPQGTSIGVTYSFDY